MVASVDGRTLVGDAERVGAIVGDGERPDLWSGHRLPCGAAVATSAGLGHIGGRVSDSFGGAVSAADEGAVGGAFVIFRMARDTRQIPINSDTAKLSG